MKHVTTTVVNVGPRRIVLFEYKDGAWLLWGKNDLTREYGMFNKISDIPTRVQNALNLFLEQNPDKNLISMKTENLVLKNSDTTPFSLVSQFLVEILGFNKERADVITNEINEQGHAVVGPYTKEVMDTAFAYMNFIGDTMGETLVLPMDRIACNDVHYEETFENIKSIIANKYPEDFS